MPNQQDKQELHEHIVAAAGGDEVAWRWIVDAYAHRVFALIRSKCANEELAEEIKENNSFKPIRVIKNNTSSEPHYDIVGGQIRFWAWMIAYGEKKAVPACIEGENEV